MNELKIAVETFQNLLIDLSTGGSCTEDEYNSQRNEILNAAEIKDIIPDFIKTNRSTGQFWQFIKFKYPTYAERRNYIWQEFSVILDFLEKKHKGVIDDSISQKLDKLNLKYINAEWLKALERKIDDPEGAITTARTLIETTCKYILDELNVEYKDDIELPKLYKLTAEKLNLAPDQHTEQIFKQILGGCQTVVEGLGALRNKLSDSHGKKGTQIKPSSRHAELAVNLSGTMTTFLLETFEFRMQQI